MSVLCLKYTHHKGSLKVGPVKLCDDLVWEVGADCFTIRWFVRL